MSFVASVVNSVSGARRQTYNLFTPNRGGKVGYYIDWAIMLLIVGSVTAVILETVDPIATQTGSFFPLFELVSTAIFTVEYVGRIWSAVETGEYESPVFGRIKFAAQPLLIVDLLAIAPFYLALLGIGADLRFLRALRLVRLLRLLKLARYSTALQAFGHVVYTKREQLALAFGANIMLLVLGSSIMYFVENPAQPEAFSSIPASFWWGIATQTTVGYGDITPVTPLGRMIAGLFALIGIGLFALPAAILASGFMDVVDEDTELQHCPHCGEDLDEYR
jgi:voltage-gated potassium channel